MSFAHVIQGVLNFLNEPFVKAGLGWVFGQLWVRYPNAKARAIPVLVLAGSVFLGLAQVLAALVSLAGGQTSAASVAQAVGSSSVSGAILDAVFGTLIPVVCATGTHSWLKNFGQWVAEGYGLFHKPKAKRAKTA